MFSGMVGETLFTALKAAGYHVGYHGKWHLRAPEMREWQEALLERDAGALDPYVVHNGIEVDPRTYVPPEEREQPFAGVETTGRGNYTGDPETYLPGYYGTVASCDYAFGRLLQTLREIGEYENALVVFTSDHGDLVGSHGGHAKSCWYEESIAVPLLMGLPGKIRPQRVDTIFSNVHLAPTILGLLGVEGLPHADGQDLSGPLLGEGEMPEVEEELILMAPAMDRVGSEGGGRFAPRAEVNGSPSWWWEWRGLRTRTHTYAARNYRGEVRRWLFDNEADPYQLAPIQDEKLFAQWDEWVRRRLHAADPFFAWMEQGGCAGTVGEGEWVKPVRRVELTQGSFGRGPRKKRMRRKNCMKRRWKEEGLNRRGRGARGGGFG